MWMFKANILKSLEKNKKSTMETLQDAIEASNLQSREILVDAITPQTADFMDNLIRFWNLVDDETMKSYSEREPIKVYVNSLGGNLAAAFTMMDSIRISRTPVYTINTGCAYKEAFFVYIMGHKRYAYPMSSFVFHRDAKQFDDTATESSFYNYSSFCDAQLEEIKRTILDKTKITETQYDKHCKNDWWFNSDEALKNHICNEVVRDHIFKRK